MHYARLKSSACCTLRTVNELGMDSMGKRLQQARKAAGFETAREAAARLGVNHNTYAQHENGNRGFPSKRAELYARVFRVPLDWLLVGKGSVPNFESDRDHESGNSAVGGIIKVEKQKKLIVTVLLNIPTPGGDVTVQREIDAGELPGDVSLFQIDFLPGELGAGLPGGSVIGSFFEDSRPVSGNTVAVEITSEQDERKRYTVARLQVGLDDKNTLLNPDSQSPLDLQPGARARIVGKILQRRLNEPAIDGRTAKTDR